MMSALAKSINAHSCMLIRDIAKNTPNAMSAMSATAGLREGQRVPVSLGYDAGIRFDIKIPANKHVTNSANS